MENVDTIAIELVYALPDQQTLLALQVPVGCSVIEAVKRSGLLERFPEIDMQTASFGIFSKLEKLPAQRVLQAGERVEIYRPLLIDPKEARKARAEKARKKRVG